MRRIRCPDERLGHGLDAWRVLLLRRVVWTAVLAGLVPCALVTLEALRGGSWMHALVCWAGNLMLAGMAVRGWLPHCRRAMLSLLMLYGFGLWLLAHGSAVGPLFLLACPVMAVLAMGGRPATVALAACPTSLVLLGWWLQVPFPLTAGVAGGSFARWLIVGFNLLALSLLLTLSVGFLLRRLEQALQHQHDATQSLQRSEQLLREVASQVPGMVFRMRFGPGLPFGFLYVSPGSRDLLGLAPEALLHDPQQMVAMIHAEDMPRVLAGMSAAWRGQHQHTVEVRLRGADGHLRWLELQSNEVERDARSVVHNGIVTDITARKAAEALVWEQARVDPLTRLPNRFSLQQQLALAMAESRRSGRPMALMMLDLDHFKEVNDSLGHAHGDLLLVQAAARLRHCLRDGDVVARMGGDEFTVLLPALHDPDSIEAVGRRMLAALSDPFELESELAHVSASIGIALYPEDASTADDLLKHADQAMYRAKDGGRNRMCHFTPELEARARLRMRLGLDLRSALAAGQLRVVYQPIVDLATGHVCKAEALLRWTHPDLGEVSPAEFIPIAESTGQIGEIGDWVFHTAANQVLRWRRSVHPGFQVSVNRSPLQFRSEFAPRQPWPEVLAKMGLAGDAVVVEITEGLLLDSGDAVARQLGQLRAAGMRVSLDDFGTGYSALAYLHRFELDMLKIDRSFVSGVSAGDTGRSLCRALVLMAHELGMRVVAEGVETAEQCDWLRQAGCDLAQGYHFGRPMTPAEFEAWLARRSAKAPAPALACSA